MTNVKITFKPRTYLFAALNLVRNLNSRVVILTNDSFMLEVGITDLGQLDSIRKNHHVMNVSVFKNEAETVRGLFGDDD